MCRREPFLRHIRSRRGPLRSCSVNHRATPIDAGSRHPTNLVRGRRALVKGRGRRTIIQWRHSLFRHLVVTIPIRLLRFCATATRLARPGAVIHSHVCLGSSDATSFASLACKFTMDVTAQTARAGKGSVASYSAGVARVAGHSVPAPSSLAVRELDRGGGRGRLIPLGIHFRTSLAGKGCVCVYSMCSVYVEVRVQRKRCGENTLMSHPQISNSAKISFYFVTITSLS